MRKLRIGVIFGGRSGEHEVSLASAQSVLAALDRRKYDVLPIGIDKTGRWLSSQNALKLLAAGKRGKSDKIIVPDPNERTLVALKGGRPTPGPLDCVFPLIHGTYGEDGSLQGLLELADLPYVGAGVLASAIGMDKVTQKQLFERISLPVTPYHFFMRDQWLQSRHAVTRAVQRTLRWPIFVKPANLGSSVGITKVQTIRQFAPAVRTALRYDRKVIAEQGILRAREIECAVIGNARLRVSIPGELVPKRAFYDYAAKYLTGDTAERVPAPLRAKTVRRIQSLALQAFRVIDCAGMARVDFLISPDERRVWVSEVNTIPGFTPISMFAKLWTASGLAYPKLLDELIRLARERFQEKRRLTRTFVPRNG